jgi:hypothetical protein
VLRVVDDQRHRVVTTDALEEGHPRREEVLPGERADRADAEQRGEAVSQPALFGRVGDVVLEGSLQEPGDVLVDR